MAGNEPEERGPAQWAGTSRTDCESMVKKSISRNATTRFLFEKLAEVMLHCDGQCPPGKHQALPSYCLTS